jgi:hypothetical protein
MNGQNQEEIHHQLDEFGGGKAGLDQTDAQPPQRRGDGAENPDIIVR